MKPLTHETDGENLFVDKPGAISTWTGLRVDPLNATAEDISIEDIAHALARQCRYNGHCDGFLSVARHSLWVSERLAPLGATMALWGLLHDAAETYLGDMVRPLKHSPEMKLYREADERLERVLADAFDLPWPMPAEVHEADHYVCLELEMPDYRSTWVGSVVEDERDFLRRYALLTKGEVTRPDAAPIIIGISGRKRSGKDTAAKFLIAQHGFERIAFADKLRAVALGTDPYVAVEHAPVARRGFGSEIRITYERLSDVVTALGWERAKEFPDVRRLLQRLGTEGVRENLGYSTWIDAAFSDVQPGGRYVFTDCRFPNEAEAIRARGGKVWEIVRPSDASGDAHASETPLPREFVDRIIANDGTRVDLRRAVLREWTPA